MRTYIRVAIREMEHDENRNDRGDLVADKLVDRLLDQLMKFGLEGLTAIPWPVIVGALKTVCQMSVRVFSNLAANARIGDFC